MFPRQYRVRERAARHKNKSHKHSSRVTSHCPSYVHVSSQSTYLISPSLESLLKFKHFTFLNCIWYLFCSFYLLHRATMFFEKKKETTYIVCDHRPYSSNLLYSKNPFPQPDLDQHITFAHTFPQIMPSPIMPAFHPYLNPCPCLHTDLK